MPAAVLRAIGKKLDSTPSAILEPEPTPNHMIVSGKKMIFGRSSVTITMMGFVAGLAPVILKTLEGLTAVRPVLLDVGRSHRLTRMQLFCKIEFPAAVPTIFTGLRLGLIFALINVVGVEFLINFGGLGQLINDLAERYDLPGTYAAVVFVIFVSVAVFALLEQIESWMRPGT